MSKYFKEHEIIGYLYIDGKRVTYLKTGVKRNPKYNDHLEEDEMNHINQSLIALQRYTEYLRKVVGVDDFTEHE